VLLAGMLVPQAGAATASRASTTRISKGTKPPGEGSLAVAAGGMSQATSASGSWHRAQIGSTAGSACPSPTGM
jgi:hypothetical protein